MYNAVKQISRQKSSSISIPNLRELLGEAGVTTLGTGYRAYLNFSYATTMYVIENVGYIARRTKDHRDAPITIHQTIDGHTCLDGTTLSKVERECFATLFNR